MTTTTPESPPLKTDALGRIHVYPEHREALLDAFEKSSLSGIKFAAAHGIKYTTFANWVQKRRRERSQYEPRSEPAPTALIESLVELDLPVAHKPRPEAPLHDQEGGLHIHHASGIRMNICNSEHAKLAAILIAQLNASD